MFYGKNDSNSKASKSNGMQGVFTPLFTLSFPLVGAEFA
jgi:hypothetical protein